MLKILIFAGTKLAKIGQIANFAKFSTHKQYAYSVFFLSLFLFLSPSVSPPPFRAVAQKLDILLTSGSLAGGGGGGGGATTGAPVAANLAIEIANIKTTEGNILHQLADLK